MKMHKTTKRESLTAAAVAALTLSAAAMPSGPASWGQEPRPAVVGEIGAEYGEYRMSLNGEWDFIAVTATTPHRNAVWGDQYVLKADGWPGATKGLVWEGDGWLLLYKRLEKDNHFTWPRTGTTAISISEQQFDWLLHGFSIHASVNEVFEPPKHYL